MTIRQLLNDAASILARAAVPDARLDAEYLLCDLLHEERLRMKLDAGREVPPDTEQAFRSRIQRRAQREPLQYILGTQYFMGFPFHVCEDVLIPRFDTELMCQMAVRLAPEKGCVLELCTGSGAPAIALKKLRPDLKISASDLSEKALAVARENARQLNADVSFIQSDLFESVPGTYDLIMANPPYIDDAGMAALQAEVRKEPRMALSGGPDGLCFYRRIAGEAPAHLSRQGFLILEIGDTQYPAVCQLLQGNFTDIALHYDLNPLPRVVTAKRR